MVATCSSKRTDKSVDDEARERLDEMRRDERREHDRCLSDHVVRLTGQHRRNFRIKNPCRPEIDNEFKLGRLFDREVSGLVALRIGVRAVVREGRLHSRAYMGSFSLRGLTWVRI